ncbi:arsenate-mycothiol transferase ArsC [Azospirillum rugosum]|uniref:Protein-tyrosine-phosphatase n=1 Tax=Azospirillum rugosum TaxID=416170 RepID=A0ABS4SV00_9PROT|nr:low molecular weight phosphatase family protein [Azospirillum rugosum]MBP2296387.1 protein-tyrosine-phosphatase [Azospirillum rugosum]MDQ0529908.1 protein-tyrosine-phosphatase [Azospirillum rugosum]
MAPVLQPLPVTSVLFACTYNMIRSPMAAAMMRHFHGARVYVDSVGVREGDEVDPFAVAVMEEMGIDLSRHRCRTFEDLEDTNFDLIVSLSPEAQHRAIEMTRTMACDVEFWNTFDPTLIHGNRETMMETYRKVRDGLLDKIKDRFPLSRGPTV